MPVIFISGVFLLLSETAFAHDPVTSSGQERWAALTSVLTLIAFWALYLTGSLHNRPKLSYALLFHFGLVLCALAVLGPLDEWAETNEAAHMTQHMLFMTIIAPIWVIARPLPQLLAGPGQAVAPLWNSMMRLTQYPMLCAYIHGFLIWFWHVPYFYVLALDNPWWHIIEHACFIISAGLFWWAVLKSSRARAPWALLAVLLTLMHTGFLGALLTFAGEPFYGENRTLADQQLAGLIMWVAGGVPYILASLWIGSRWYSQLLSRINS